MNKDRVRKILAILGIILILGGAAWWWYARGPGVHRRRAGRRAHRCRSPRGSAARCSRCRSSTTRTSRPAPSSSRSTRATTEVALSSAPRRTSPTPQAALEAATDRRPDHGHDDRQPGDPATAAVERVRTRGIAIAGKDVDAARARLAGGQARLREAQANETRVGARSRAHEAAASPRTRCRSSSTTRPSRPPTPRGPPSKRAQAPVAEAEQARARWPRAGGAQAAERRAQARGRPAHRGHGARAGGRDRARAPRRPKRGWSRPRPPLEQAELNLAYTTVKAPVAGVVSKKSVEVGPGRASPASRCWRSCRSTTSG